MFEVRGCLYALNEDELHFICVPLGHNPYCDTGTKSGTHNKLQVNFK
jgi:hypothetical protein